MRIVAYTLVFSLAAIASRAEAALIEFYCEADLFDNETRSQAPSWVDTAAAPGLVVGNLGVPSAAGSVFHWEGPLSFSGGTIYSVNWVPGGRSFEFTITVPTNAVLTINGISARLASRGTGPTNFAIFVDRQDDTTPSVSVIDSQGVIRDSLPFVSNSSPTNLRSAPGLAMELGAGVHTVQFRGTGGGTAGYAIIDEVRVEATLDVIHTPEPASVTLLLAAGAGCLAIRRRV